MIFAALDEAARKDELLIVEGGLLRYHQRRDGWVVIREIIVLPEYRGEGIGRMLVERVRCRHRLPMRAKCPVVYPSNAFWKAIGFKLVREEKGVNVWECQP